MLDNPRTELEEGKCTLKDTLNEHLFSTVHNQRFINT